MSASPSSATNADTRENLPSRVADDTGNRPLWIGLAAIALTGITLFTMMESRRQAALAPAVKPRAAELSRAPFPLPTLFIPPEPINTAPLAFRRIKPAPGPSQQLPTVATQLPLSSAQKRSAPSDAAAPADTTRPYPLSAQIVQAVRPDQSSPVVVYDNGIPARSASDGPASLAGGLPNTSPPPSAIKARFGPNINRSLSIEQGTLIPAVLETAIDSTQPGRARALVSNNVYSMDGNRILIARGSKLVGEYRGDLATGQKRAFVQWTRLVRPDGVIVDLDSPATDTLGRAGIKGRVDSQFLERFGGALLQSTLDFGSFALSRSISNSGVVVALPGGSQGSNSQLIQPPGKPIIRIRQGTRISVLVARDLDFSGVERDP